MYKMRSLEEIYNDVNIEDQENLDIIDSGTPIDFGTFETLADTISESINKGIEQVAIENYVADKDIPIFYGEYDGETIPDMMEDFYATTEILPEDENGFVDGTFIFNVTFIPNSRS